MPIFGISAGEAAEDAARIEADAARKAQLLQFQLNYPNMQVGQSAMFQLADLYGLDRPASPIQYNEFINPATGGFYGSGGFGGMGGGFDLGGMGGGFDFGSGGDLGGSVAESLRSRFAPRPQPGFASPAAGTPDERRTAALSKFQTSPDYTFRLNEGLKALERSAAARGSLLSGGQLKAAQQYGGDLASTEYNNYVNRLMGLAGFNTGPQAADRLGSLEQSRGSALAGGEVAAANARASGFQNTLQLGMMAAGAAGGFGGGGGAGPAYTSNPFQPGGFLV